MVTHCENGERMEDTVQTATHAVSTKVEPAAVIVEATTAAAAAVDPLLPWLSTQTTSARAIVDAIETEGYVLIPGVFSLRECEAEIDRLWAYVEATSGGSVRREDPTTWYPSTNGEIAEEDPWPHSGWRSFPDMFQSFQAGWLFSELREALAERVFEPLYGTRALYCSKEGFTFHRPTSAGVHPARNRATFVCGVRTKRSAGEHFDQSAATVGLHCIQSSTALLDQTNDPDAGCFLCWPGSHRHHVELIAATYRGRKEWVPLTDAELDRLEYAGLEPRRVRAAAGDVILWRSDLAHAAASPGPNSTSFRAVAYACMLPVGCSAPAFLDALPVEFRSEPTHSCEHQSHNQVPGDNNDWSHAGASEKTLSTISVGDQFPRTTVASWSMIPGGERKLRAYLQTETGDHRPGAECWLSPKPSRAAVVRGAFFEGTPPRLTWRQAELYGLVPYFSLDYMLRMNPREREALRRTAEDYGVRFVSNCWDSIIRTECEAVR